MEFMTEQERQTRTEVYARQQQGYAYLREERLLGLSDLRTSEVIPAFNVAFRQSLLLPPRLQSGYTDFQRALALLASECRT